VPFCGPKIQQTKAKKPATDIKQISVNPRLKNDVQKPLKTRSFLAKRCKKTFIFDKKMQKTPIFTLIFSPKTHKSYKITLFTTANRPVFQKNRKKTDFLKIHLKKLQNQLNPTGFFNNWPAEFVIISHI
jgi:hypothetical protein